MVLFSKKYLTLALCAGTMLSSSLFAMQNEEKEYRPQLTQFMGLDPDEALSLIVRSAYSAQEKIDFIRALRSSNPDSIIPVVQDMLNTNDDMDETLDTIRGWLSEPKKIQPLIQEEQKESETIHKNFIRGYLQTTDSFEKFVQEFLKNLGNNSQVGVYSQVIAVLGSDGTNEKKLAQIRKIVDLSEENKEQKPSPSVQQNNMNNTGEVLKEWERSGQRPIPVQRKVQKEVKRVLRSFIVPNNIN